jgi:hypothetical protein
MYKLGKSGVSGNRESKSKYSYLGGLSSDYVRGAAGRRVSSLSTCSYSDLLDR